MSKRARRQAGITLLMAAVILMILLVMAALAVDLGVAYTARTSAQHSADAGALAGAYTYVNAPTITGDERIAVATRDAAGVANNYTIIGHQVAVSTAAQDPNACDAGENIVCVNEAKKRVTVVVAVPVDTYFAKVIPFDLLKVKVTATAEAAENTGGSRCIKPFYISNDIISSLPPSDKHATVADQQARCQQSKDLGQVIFDSNGQVTQYAKDYINAQTRYANSASINDPGGCQSPSMTSGCPLPFWGQNNVNPSQFGLVDFSAGQGNGDELMRCSVSSCLQQCYSSKPIFQCGDAVVGQKTGQSVGQIEAGLQDVTGQGPPPSNTYVSAGVYSNSGVQSTSSPAVMAVIVWDCLHPVNNGTGQDIVLANPLGIAHIFLNLAEKGSRSNFFLIGATDCGQGGHAPGPGTVPIRLVNPS